MKRTLRTPNIDTHAHTHAHREREREQSNILLRAGAGSGGAEGAAVGPELHSVSGDRGIDGGLPAKTSARLGLAKIRSLRQGFPGA